MTADFYTAHIRFYSKEGLLVWKTEDWSGSIDGIVEQIRMDLERTGVIYGAVGYPNEPNSHRAIHGHGPVLCQKLNRCNIQVRKNGKLIPWKHLL